MTERTNKYRNPPPRRVIGPKGGRAPPAQQPPQMMVQPIPKTILIECNRYNSVEKDDTNYTLWKSEFSGGINIKKGDELRIHSAYLSSRGVADLIAFVQDENNQNYDSEANWIMEYYITNDGKNGKRNGYNLNGGKGTFFYDLDMRPLRVERILPDRSKYPTQRAYSVGDFSYYQDPYCPARITGAGFNVKSFQLPTDANTVYQVDIVKIYGNFFDSAFNEQSYANPGTSSSDRTYYAVALSKLDNSGNLTFVNANQIGFMGGAIQITPTQNSFPSASYKPSSSYQFAIYGYYNYPTLGGLYDNVNMFIVQDLPTFDPGLPNNDGRRLGTCTISWLKAQTNVFTSVDDSGDTTVILPPPSLPNFSQAIEKVGDIYYSYEAFWQCITDDSEKTFTVLNDAESGNEPLQAKITKTNFQTAMDTNPALKNIGQIITPCNVNYLENPSTPGDYNFVEIVLSDKFNVNTLQDLIDINNFCNVFAFRLVRTNVDAVAQFGLYEYVVFSIVDATQNGAFANCPVSIQGRNVIRIEGDVFRCYNQLPSAEQIPLCYADDVSIQGEFLLYGYCHNNAPTVEGTHSNQLATGCLMELSHPTKQQYYSISENPTLSPTPVNQQTNFTWIPANQYGDVEPTFTNEALASTLQLGAQEGYTVARSQYSVFADGVDVSAPMLYFNAINVPQVVSLNERIHYGMKNFKIEDEYASPSDLAEELTLQTHNLTDLRDKKGIPIPNTKELGLAVNEFIFPVYTSAYEADGTTKIEEPGRGNGYLLNGTLPEGSFQLNGAAYNMKAFPTYTFNGDGDKTGVQTGGTTEAVEANGELPNQQYTTYFQTQFTSINKPLPTDATKQSMPQNAIQDFYMPSNVQYADITAMIPRTILQKNTPLPSIGYPYNFTPNGIKNMLGEATSTEVSQMCGSDNVAFLWDDTQSRMTIQFLHQPFVSIFSITPTGVSTGGENSAVLYYPLPTGYDNYPYHLNQTRDGGINIVNWCSNQFSYPSTPTQVRKIAGIEDDFTVNLGDDWFLQTNPSGASKNYYKPGNRFWNKLGFTDNQIFDEVVGSTTDATTGYYYPKGTTDAKIDTAFSMLTSEPPAADQPFFNSSGHWADAAGTKEGDNVAVVAGFKYSSLGALFWNNNAYGYSTPNTSGLPVEYTPVPQKPTPDGKSGLPSADPQKTTFNPNLNRHTGYTVQAKESTELKAAQLPIKTTDSYFYIMSDIMKTDFYISNNRGTPLNCVGVISKLNGSNDFYYSYGSPQSFFFDEDKTITSITIEIRSTDLTVPPAISPYSSVIFQLVRSSPQPINPLPTIPQRQEQYTANFLQWWKTQGQAMAKKHPRNIALLLSQMAAVGMLDMDDQSEVLNDLQEQLAGGGVAPPQNAEDAMDEILFRRGDVDLPQREADPAPGELVAPVPIALNPQSLQALEEGASMELPLELGVVRDRLVEDRLNQDWLAFQQAQGTVQQQQAIDEFSAKAQAESGLGSSIHGSQAGPGASERSASELASRRSEMADVPDEEEEEEEEEGLE